MNISNFWKDVLEQSEENLQGYFHDEAIIRWHCSNELFTVQEYIRANCEYPGTWRGEIERIEETTDTIISAVKVYPVDRSQFFHVVSFLKIADGLIIEMDEYWSDDEIAPEWRLRMNIGKPIN